MAHGPAKGIGRWLFTTNHKDIGTMYLWFSFAMFLLGGFFAMVIRAELFQPGMQLVKPEFFNQMTTMHGLVMVFGAIMPVFVGLANWMIPMMIGAPDMALPRMNNLSFWILPFAFLMLTSTLFMDGGGPNFGWTFYAPLSTTYAPDSVNFFIFAIHIMGASFIMRYDIDENADVRLDLVDYRIPSDCCDAGTGGCCDHDADGHQFWYQLL